MSVAVLQQTERLPKPETDIGALRRDIDEFGYCLVADAIGAGEAAAIRDRLDEQAAAERELGMSQQNPAHVDTVNQWLHMLINKGRPFRNLLRHPLARGVTDHVLGREYLLSALDAHIVRPGGNLMPLHIDQWWMPLPSLPGEPANRPGDIRRETVPSGPPTRASRPIPPPAVVNCFWMISDFTADNGATRIVPRSHLSGAQPSRAIPHDVETVAVTGKAGTLLIFEGRTWHAAGINSSRTARHGISMYFCGPQYRQLQNFPLGTRPEVLAEADDDLRRLLGFKVWSSYGMLDNADDVYISRDQPTLGELRPRR